MAPCPLVLLLVVYKGTRIQENRVGRNGGGDLPSSKNKCSVETSDALAATFGKLSVD